MLTLNTGWHSSPCPLVKILRVLKNVILCGDLSVWEVRGKIGYQDHGFTLRHSAIRLQETLRDDQKPLNPRDKRNDGPPPGQIGISFNSHWSPVILRVPRVSKPRKTAMQSMMSSHCTAIPERPTRLACPVPMPTIQRSINRHMFSCDMVGVPEIWWEKSSANMKPKGVQKPAHLYRGLQMTYQLI